MSVIETGKKFGAIKDDINHALGYIVPVGTVLPYAGNKLPDGWLWCDGTSYARTDYEDLANVISNGNANNFVVPDLSRHYLMGMNNMNAGAKTSYQQNNEGNLGAATIQSVQAGYTGHTNSVYNVYSNAPGKVDLPYVALRFIIKY